MNYPPITHTTKKNFSLLLKDNFQQTAIVDYPKKDTCGEYAQKIGLFEYILF